MKRDATLHDGINNLTSLDQENPSQTSSNSPYLSLPNIDLPARQLFSISGSE